MVGPPQYRKTTTAVTPTPTSAINTEDAAANVTADVGTAKTPANTAVQRHPTTHLTTNDRDTSSESTSLHETDAPQQTPSAPSVEVTGDIRRMFAFHAEVIAACDQMMLPLGQIT
ncbi:unnamed protein product [Penicillium glandicola]